MNLPCPFMRVLIPTALLMSDLSDILKPTIDAPLAGSPDASPV
jgi:hypothetical protein